MTWPPTSSSSAAATPGSGPRGSCARGAPRSCCWSPSCAGMGRAGATAASARRCGRTCRRWCARFGRERALAVCRASSESVGMIGAWCSEQGVDAWFERKGYMLVSTAPAHDRFIDEISAAAPPNRVTPLTRGRRARALRLAALPARADRPGRRHRPARAAGARPAGAGDRGRGLGVRAVPGARAAHPRGRRDRARPPAAACAPAPRCWPSTPPRAASSRCAPASRSPPRTSC